ncbi:MULTISPECIES: hypothetical protein [Amycolatopsis]|uniref:hypothetical protein n=1 Tax=Amycolatopsis TaxID=1813 RepID=UPI00106F357B|nr:MULTISPECIES: hypothetical protein [Amycolatopsis]
MSWAARLVRLYPASLRSRWGAGLEDEARAAGWRRLPNLVVGALDMWVHPVVWPADSAAQRRSRASALVFAAGLSGWLLGHVAVEDSLLPENVVHSWAANISDVLVLAGLVLVVPLPRLSVRAMLRLVAQALRRLAVPVVIGGAVYVAANLSASLSPGLRITLLVGWWLALVLGSVQVCTVVAGLDPEDVVAPEPGRLWWGIGMVAAALAVGGGVVLWSTVVDGVTGLLPLVLGGALLVLTALCGWTLRDLYTLSAG